MFKGVITAIVTPFKEGEVDYEKFEELIEWQIENKVQGILPCGTTGESATLSHQEHKDIIKFVVSIVKKRVPVIAGTGSNNTMEAIDLTESAKKDGADAALLITPYYNKPTQEGLYRHFSLICESVDIPVILYNVPTRTGVNMLPSTIAKLAKNVPNIIGVKEASGSIDQTSEILQLTEEKISVLSGDDSLTLALISVGAKGVISVVSNIAPDKMRSLCDYALCGNFEEARKIHYKLFPLMKALFIETNPIPVKKALYLMNKINDEIRLPLTLMSQENIEKLKDAMKKAGVL